MKIDKHFNIRLYFYAWTLEYSSVYVFIIYIICTLPVGFEAIVKTVKCDCDGRGDDPQRSTSRIGVENTDHQGPRRQRWPSRRFSVLETKHCIYYCYKIINIIKKMMYYDHCSSTASRITSNTLHRSTDRQLQSAKNNNGYNHNVLS